MEKLFTYGTLQDPVIQQQIMGRTIAGSSDQVRGFILNRVVFPPYPVALPAGHDQMIDGMVLTVTQDELIRMDEYETDVYIRIRVMLESGTEAWMYRGNPHYFYPITGENPEA